MPNALDSSFGDLLSYLGSYSLGTGLTDDSVVKVLRHAHKRLYALLCWQLQLRDNANEAEMLWLNECVSDIVQCTPLLAQGFYKAAKVLHRSAIENIIKFTIARQGGNLSNISAVYQLFDALKILPCASNPEVTTRVDGIRDTYGLLCNYVHSSGKPHMALAQALKEYPAVNAPLLSSTGSELAGTLHKINGLLFVLERPTFDSMYHGNREAILDNLQATEKRRLV